MGVIALREALRCDILECVVVIRVTASRWACYAPCLVNNTFATKHGRCAGCLRPR